MNDIELNVIDVGDVIRPQPEQARCESQNCWVWPEQVDDILITRLHTDYTSGLVEGTRPPIG